jgi:hypothetical protein
MSTSTMPLGRLRDDVDPMQLRDCVAERMLAV